MANEQNLKPIEKGQLSSEEAKRRGRNGGRASGKTRRKRKALSDAFETLLTLPEAPGSVEELDEALSADELQALIAKHNEEQCRKAAALEELARTPGIPGNVKSALMELYRYELHGVEFAEAG